MQKSERSNDQDLRTVFVQLADALDERGDVIETMDLLVHPAVRFTAAVEAGNVLAYAGGNSHVGTTGERTSSTPNERAFAARSGQWRSDRASQRRCCIPAWRVRRRGLRDAK